MRQPTPEATEQLVLSVRQAHPAWGGRKIRRVLQNRGHEDVPAASTVTAILRRHGQIDATESAKHRACRRFERAEPNELWQMDFKGEFKMSNGHWCYPLTVMDDHSRYNLGLRACMNQKRPTVQRQLTDVFERYGLPRQILADNGTPWAVSHRWRGWTKLKVWLLRLDVVMTHGRPYHPQTQGKEERFHRTLKLELLQGGRFDDLTHTQTQFDPWRQMYNHERPHDALDLNVPASRYRISDRQFPVTLPTVEYSSLHQVRKLNPVGQLSFQGRVLKMSEAFGGLAVGLRPTTTDGLWDVYFSRHRIGQADLRTEGQNGSNIVVMLPTSARCAPFGGQHHHD
jgi:transposase InsO family protein